MVLVFTANPATELDLRKKGDRQAGQTLLPVVVFMAVVMLGMLAFAVDVGYIFHEKRLAQSAADAAAIAAAEEYTYNGDVLGTDATNAANAAAAQNGFDPSASLNPATVTVTTASSGNYTSSGSGGAPSAWVVATVSKPVPTFFMGGFRSRFGTMTVSATAQAAGKQDSPTCVCLEGTSGNDLNMSNGSSMTINGCGLMSDSSSSSAIQIAGNSHLCATSVAAEASSWDTTGNITGNSSVCSSAQVIQGSNSACAPPMPTPPADTSCSADPSGGSWGTNGLWTVGPNSAYGTTEDGDTICYSNLNVNENGTTVTLNPGIYVINGGTLHFYGDGKSNGGGDGVFFYLENGAKVVMDNGAIVNLVAGGNPQSGGGTAPDVGSSGEYDGIVFYQDSSDTSAMTLAGGSSSYLNGAVYAPAANITLNNGSNSTVDADIVAKTLTTSGGGDLVSNPITNLGTNNTSTAKLTQ